MKYITDNQGLSRLEVLCITGICSILILVAFWGYNYYRSSIYKGNDSLRTNTAESVAEVNLLSGGCVVNGCDSDNKVCSHEDKDGYTTGYYDNMTHDIMPEKMAGYNEYHVMQIGDNTYEGKANTMIIKVTGKQDKIRLSWVEGDN